jgi:hypothetical protein
LSFVVLVHSASASASEGDPLRSLRHALDEFSEARDRRRYESTLVGDDDILQEVWDPLEAPPSSDETIGHDYFDEFVHGGKMTYEEMLLQHLRQMREHKKWDSIDEHHKELSVHHAHAARERARWGLEKFKFSAYAIQLAAAVTVDTVAIAVAIIISWRMALEMAELRRHRRAGSGR